MEDRIKNLQQLAFTLDGTHLDREDKINGATLVSLCAFDGPGYKRMVAWYQKKIHDAEESRFETELKDKQTYETGATRDNAEGKGRYDLIPSASLKRLALVYERGAKNHPESGGRNWEKGIPYSRLISSATRHILQFRDGMTNEDHLGHAIWNLMAIIHFEEKGPEGLNDLNI